MSSETLFIIVAVFSSVTAPLILATINDRQRRAEKQEDYRRQDEVAGRAAAATQALAASQAQLAAGTEATRLKAEETAALLVANQLKLQEQTEATRLKAEEAAILLAENNAAVAASTVHTNEQLSAIHILVNSNMTTAMQGEYDATVSQLAVMKELVALHAQNGTTPTPDVLSAIEAIEAKVHELGTILSDRRRAATELGDSTCQE